MEVNVNNEKTGAEGSTKDKKDDKDSQNELINEKKENNEKNEKGLKSKKSGEKRKGKKKGKKSIKEEFHLDKLGLIEYAKDHSSANRPMRRMGEFNQETKFCPCCSLPLEQANIIEPFKFCDDTDIFSTCGRGISLYFSYFRFAIFILLCTSVVICLPTFYFSYSNSMDLLKVCDDLGVKRDRLEDIPECKKFFDLEEGPEYYVNGSDWALLFSSLNAKPYQKVNKYYHSNEAQDTLNKSLINSGIIYLTGIITLLIINLCYILLLHNKNKEADIQEATPSDYTVLLTNLGRIFSKFKDIIKKYENDKNSNEKKLDEAGQEIDLDKALKSELGISEDIDLNSLTLKDKFKSFLKSRVVVTSKGDTFDVYQINICYKLKDFMKLEEKIQELKSLEVLVENDPEQSDRNEKRNLEGKERLYFKYPLSSLGIYCCDCCESTTELKEIKKERKEKSKELNEIMKKSTELNEDNFGYSCFVSFNTIKGQEEFLSQFPQSIMMRVLIFIKNLKYIFCCCCIDKKKRDRFWLRYSMQIYQAPEPEDVKFENLEYSPIFRFFRTLAVFLVSIIFIIICFILILLLNWGQNAANKYNGGGNVIIQYLLSLAITATSSGLNAFFEILLEKLTNMEKNQSMSDYYLSFSVKLTLFSFITSGVVPLVSNVLLEGDYISFMKVSGTSGSDEYDTLINNMFMMFLCNAFVTPIMWTINVSYFLKKFQICLMESKDDPDTKHNKTQRQLNELYELPSMNIAYKYSYIGKTMLMTFLYIPIFPLGAFLSLVGFILGYFLEKFNFANMYKRPEMLDETICEFYVNMFICNLFMLGIGDYVFLESVYKYQSVELVNIILTGVLIIVPYHELFERDFIGVNESELSKEFYCDKYSEFTNNYDRENPFTKIEGTKNYYKELAKNGVISEAQYNSLSKELQDVNTLEMYVDQKKNKDLENAQISINKISPSFAQNMAKLLNNKIEEEKSKDKDLPNSNNDLISQEKENNKNNQIVGQVINVAPSNNNYNNINNNLSQTNTFIPAKNQNQGFSSINNNITNIQMNQNNQNYGGFSSIPKNQNQISNTGYNPFGVYQYQNNNFQMPLNKFGTFQQFGGFGFSKYKKKDDSDDEDN